MKYKILTVRVCLKTYYFSTNVKEFYEYFSQNDTNYNRKLVIFTLLNNLFANKFNESYKK